MNPLALTLNLGVFSPNAQPSDMFLDTLEDRLQHTFLNACGGNLALTIERTDPAGGYPSNLSFVFARELHDYAQYLNRNPEWWGTTRDDGPAVPAVSAIFAEYYGPAREVLGVMFDRGFVTGDDHNGSKLYTGVPREACAIFVGAARDLRKNDQDDTADEIWFTTTHELGHLFNLQHSNETSYLSTSPGGAPFRWTQVDFSPYHKFLLQQCNSSPQVWPGGSNFGDASPFGNHDRPLRATRREFKKLSLKIDLTKHEFYRFEPVELEVNLKLPSDAQRSVSVPNRIDPGYQQFRIWIEQPNQERRLYRSPRIYCPNRSRLRLDPGQTFRRDISLFGEAGGYTFRVPGIHRIWVEFEVGHRGIVRSNDVSINVLPYRPGLPEFDTVANVFALKDSARVLYHRSTQSAQRVLPKLTRLCDAHSTVNGVGALRYAIGRAWLSRGMREPELEKKTSAARGVEQLLQALDSAKLGKHRTERAEGILTQLEKGETDLYQAIWARRATKTRVGR